MTTTIRPLDGPGTWLKGNMHGHTTNSDGSVAPAEARGWFAANGYDFVAITDHLTLTAPDPEHAPGMVQLPGSELHVYVGKGGEYHIVVLGEQIAELIAGHQTSHTPQQVLDRANAAGALAFVAHPYRLGLGRDDIVSLRGALGIEIWNSVSERYGKALSTTIWDDLLHAGWRGWGLANDDVHWRNNEQGVGWTVVRAAERSVAGVLDALRAGRFYASTGPEIHDLEVRGREVHVACSPVCAVRFIGNRWNCTGVRVPREQTISEASGRMPGDARYVRVEVVDAWGRAAWSNPVWFE